MRISIRATKLFAWAIAVVAVLSSRAHAQSFLTNGLVAYYPFDGTAEDASGNGNNGALEGSASFGMDRFGNSNACLSLPGASGTGSGVKIPSLFSMPYEPVTYSAWFLFTNYPPFPSSGDTVMTLLGREQCGDTAEGAICVYSQANTSVSNRLVYFYGASFCATQLVPPTNTWCQVALTIDSSGNLNFYFDGTNVPFTGTAPVGQPQDFWIGSSDPGGCGNAGRIVSVWDGLIDDVRVYDLVLSANEVQQLYQAESESESPCTPHPASAVATEQDGFVIAVTLKDNGCGYTNTPLVAFVGGGGTGAAAVAAVSNGYVSSITITNAGINYTSTPAMEIGGPPFIVEQPQSVTVDAYGTASFNVTASGTVNLSYQWEFNETNIPGATSSSLTITNIGQTNLGTYSVLITNAFGMTNSAAAVLGMYPYLVSPFTGLDTYWGYTNTLSVGAIGSGPLDYQWYDNGVAIAGATNSTLTYTGIQPTNGGLYTVVVSNAYGSVTNTGEQVVVNPAGVSLALYPGVTINGVVGYTYTIQRSSNLADTNAWATITNLTLTQPVQLWVDTNLDASLPANPYQFYQVVPAQ